MKRVRLTAALLAVTCGFHSASHAATAIFSSKLYSQSERKLNTIQSFLDLLTTTQ